MGTVISILLRLILLAAGLVVAAGLALAFGIVVMAWIARAAWARLTGKPVKPFIMRVDPRRGFQNVYSRADESSRTPRADAVTRGRAIADVTDVEARRPGV